MIDIHSHLLPNVDDGSRSREVTAELLAQYKEQGFDKVVCTPHQNRREQNAEKLKAAFRALCATSGLPVKLYLGAEIFYYSGMVADLKSGKLLTMNGTRYVLVEFSTIDQSISVSDAVYELRLAGYIPIIAHIERYGYLTFDDYREIKAGGALIQVNASAVRRSDSKKKLKYLLKHDLLDFVASDCHDSVHRNVDFEEIRRYISKKFPKAYHKVFENDAVTGGGAQDAWSAEREAAAAQDG